MKKLSGLSFFCPAYNDEGNLPDLIPKVSFFLRDYTERFQITIIEDGSPDKTDEIADQLARQFPYITVIHHQKNEGYAATLKEGFEISTYEYVMYTDGDNQYDVVDCVPYLSLLETHDMIAGYAVQKAVSPFRKFQSWVHNRLINILFLNKFRDVNCAFKIFKRSVLQHIKINSSPYGAFVGAELMLKAQKNAFKIAQFPVIHYERKTGMASGSKPKVVWSTIKDMIKMRFGLL